MSTELLNEPARMESLPTYDPGSLIRVFDADGAETREAATLDTENISAWFGGHKVLEDVTLEMRARCRVRT